MKKCIPFLVVVILSYSSIALAQSSSTQQVAVAGIQIKTKTAGLLERMPQQPVVILEAGSGKTLSTWNQVFAQIAAFSPVLAYDRSGLGESTSSGEQPSVSSRVKELKYLLEAMNIAPPYILVGSDLGNLFIREYASTYQDEVEGMVYVDPLVDTDNLEGIRQALQDTNLDQELLAEKYLDFQKMWSIGGQEVANQERELLIHLISANQLEWSSQKLPEVPSSVILARRSTVFPMKEGMPIDPEEFVQKMLADKVEFLNKYTLDHPEYTLTLTSGSVNALPIQEPTLIAQSVRQVLYADPHRKLVRAAKVKDAEVYAAYVAAMQNYMPASLLSERDLNMLGYSLMRFDLYEQALVLFQNNLNQHPESANGYDSMGDGLMALGRVKEAVPLYQKAVEIGSQKPHNDYELFKKNLAKGKALLAEMEP
ncbi:alpha/beta fold hydrolase [Algoriphagus halophytocola]|uniref:Alpha/beta fold hydrolase n=1 Tax=Algoriphagus halophytocola TaxID=2991499 RepID=A0ABY6MBW4_9BACT|nr:MULTISPECIES: alpha/beta hydrolase [unclassified Algoriphagus]UZD21132.1 alpha/beta fold hydrolase [Algoriphagus sp. TR-M5]WBL42301.1 alpha/beta fold hydrolase [Algoriphagus sp. TR-M9]